jgi:hypothetical protein
MIRIRCRTLFDITQTGSTGHFKPERLPFTDRSGNRIVDINTWEKSRNTQRNLETLLQIISLRTQVFEVTDPIKTKKIWYFEFSTETTGAYGTFDDPVSLLKKDANGVPMIVHLDESKFSATVMVVDGNGQNVWFDYLG